jgi:hypothetical protein
MEHVVFNDHVFSYILYNRLNSSSLMVAETEPKHVGENIM